MRLTPFPVCALRVVAGIGLLSLAGCANAPLPTWFTGEPDNSVLTAPRTVDVAPSHNVAGWPNLSTVPDKPKDFTSAAENQRHIKQMEADKTEAQALKAQIETNSTGQAEPRPPKTGPVALPLTVPPQ